MTMTAGNGSAPPLLTIPLPDAGPASTWPRPAPARPPRKWTAAPPGARLLPLVSRDTGSDTDSDSSPDNSDSETARGQRRKPDSNTVIARATTATVAAVATVAAIVSYTHIYAEGRRHGQDGLAAMLLPVSVDGVIAEASLVMLYAARNKLPVSRLARWTLAGGIGITVGANVLYGLPPGLLSPVANDVVGAILSAWPAAAFIASVEMAVRFVQDRRKVAERKRAPGGDTAGDTDNDSNEDNGEDKNPDSERDNDTDTGSAADSGYDNDKDKNPDTSRDKTRGAKPGRTAGKRPPRHRDNRERKPDKVAETLERHPDWDDSKIAAACGVHPRTVKRRRARLRDTGAGQAGTAGRIESERELPASTATPG